MRVNLVQNYTVVNTATRKSNIQSNSQEKAHIHNSGLVTLTFTGKEKNLGQIASLTPENNALGLPEAAQGGEGVVGKEMIASMRHNEVFKTVMVDGKPQKINFDARSFMPFWEYNNPKGGFKFLLHKGQKASELADEIPASQFYSANLGEDLEAVAKKFNIPTDEISYVIQSKPNGKGPTAKSKYCILEPTSLKGHITRLSEKVLGETEDVPYALFKISKNNPKYNELKGEPHYFVYTPQLARASKPYSYDCFGNVPFEAEIVNSDWMRIQAEILNKKMNTEEFGYYNPASVICHDRVAHTYGNHIANMSALGDDSVNGTKAHIIAHNTGRYYQGITDDPFKYQVVVGDASDAEVMKKLPDFNILQKAKQFGINSDQLSPRERQIAHAIMDPYLDNFKDGGGTYNILRAGISAAKMNPLNISTGTVSYTFANEMKSNEMYDAAKFLTDFYSEIETKDVLNGSTPASMELDNPDALFGRDKTNGLYKNRAGFTPFSYNGSNIEEVIAAREKNARWLTNLIWEAGEKGQDELNKLFFSDGQIQDGHNVRGYLSPIKDGDILIMGWGRPDEQKGFPISVDGLLDFFKRSDIPTETKLKVKGVFGAGPWNKNAEDWKAIDRAMKELETLDGGIYKHNLMYVDGWFSKRLVGCATYCAFTSRREMCGITPLEAKAAGVPYAVTKTGGPVDYTNALNGFMTKEAVERNPEYYGLNWNNSKEEIDAARVKRQASQMSDIYKDMIDEYTDNHDSFVAKCKKNIEERIDWHNNNEYNRGKSANRRYLDDILETNKTWESRNQKPLNRIVGKFGEFKEEVETLMGKTKSKPLKMILAIALGTIAVAGGIYMYLNKKSTKSEQLSSNNNASIKSKENETISKKVEIAA